MNLDTKIPPPIVTIIILSIIYLFDLNEYNLNTDIISIITLFIGLIFIISAVIQFINRKTSWPKKPNPITASVDKQADAKCFGTSEADSPQWP